MIKYRPHRGGLAESMAEYREFETAPEMLDHVHKECTPWQEHYPREDMFIQSYGYPCPDERIGWTDTFLIMCKGHILGMCDRQS